MAQVRYYSKQVVSGGDQSQTTVASNAMNVQATNTWGFQMNIVSGTASGTFDVQVSYDHLELNGSVVNAGSWVKLGSGYTITVTSGAFPDGTSSAVLNVANHSAPYTRILYTKTSGTGTFNAYLTGKTI